MKILYKSIKNIILPQRNRTKHVMKHLPFSLNVRQLELLCIIIHLKCFRSVFGVTVGPNPLTGETTGTQYYEDIRIRATPAAMPYSSQMVVGTNTTPISIASNTTPVKVLPVQQRTVTAINPTPDSTAPENPVAQRTPAPASPILKAQLSAPPKPPTPNQAQNPVTKIDSKSQVGPSPHSKSHSLGSHFLILSLSFCLPFLFVSLQPFSYFLLHVTEAEKKIHFELTH